MVSGHPSKPGVEAMNDELDDHEQTYRERNDAIQHTIDVLAQYDPAEIDEYGTKAEIAREHGVAQHRIHYVLNRWDELVTHRRRMNADPLDSDAVKAAYDDDTLAAMAGQEPVADGAGDIEVDIRMTLDEVFRAIKLLPGDLGLNVYVQTLSELDIDRHEARRLFDDS